MAIIDAKLLFSNDQAITATADSTNTLNFGTAESFASAVYGSTAPGQEYAPGLPLYVVFKVTADFDNMTSLNVVVKDSADNSTFAAVAGTSFDVALASAVAGYTKAVRLPEGMSQYAKLTYTVTGTAPSAGTVVAYLSNHE